VRCTVPQLRTKTRLHRPDSEAINSTASMAKSETSLDAYPATEWTVEESQTVLKVVSAIAVSAARGDTPRCVRVDCE
jgi:hypothetical protein